MVNSTIKIEVGEIDPFFNVANAALKVIEATHVAGRSLDQDSPEIIELHQAIQRLGQVDVDDAQAEDDEEDHGALS